MRQLLSPDQARNLSALQLAFIGDAVFSLHIRENSLQSGKGLHGMHQGTTSRVNAAAQARALARIMDALTPEEQDIVRRGRNAHPRHAAPRSATSAQYAASTGLEALIGYHHLTGQDERLAALYELMEDKEPD